MTMTKSKQIKSINLVLDLNDLATLLNNNQNLSQSQCGGNEKFKFII